MLSDLNLLNARAHLHPALTPPATYQRGTECIDYMFISPGLLPALTKAGFLPYHSTMYSDHCALWADFDPSIMFLGEKGTVLDTASRKLISTNPRARKKYIELLQSMFKAHNIFT
eukprot:2519861-Ditylum_brightwellii.AAC.1